MNEDEPLPGVTAMGSVAPRRGRPRRAGHPPGAETSESQPFPVPATRNRDADMIIGERIRSRRQALGISTRQLAMALNATAQQLANYESGIRRMAASRLDEIAKLLSVPISYFFVDEATASQLAANPTAELPPPPKPPTSLRADQERLVDTVVRFALLASQVEDPELKSVIRELLQILPGLARPRSGEEDDG